MARQLFWLHIKKSAGMSTRRLLQPYYKEVDRERKPITFIQAHPDEYNDILNNFRVVLGEYQFRRCQFARQYLYPASWNEMYSFAFSREPVDRCVSMFYYLFWKEIGVLTDLARSLKRFVRSRKLQFSQTYAFDSFLDYAQQARVSDSIYEPLGLHFTTHTAPMWDDITDSSGAVMLTAVYRMEALTTGLNQVFEACSLDKRLETSQAVVVNQNTRRRLFVPSAAQRKKIEQLYHRDFEIYERARQ